MSTRSELAPAVFVDRDGVLIEDVDLLARPDQVRLIDGAAEALSALKSGGFRLIMATNQPVVARGLATLQQVEEVHRELDRLLVAEGTPPLDASYVCPHHPNATLPNYRAQCDCRKPRPGLLLKAAREHRLDLASSFLVGDRITDIGAGKAAGCHTIMVRTGRHESPPIVTVDPLDPDLRPDHECADLREAADHILTEEREG